MFVTEMFISGKMFDFHWKSSAVSNAKVLCLQMRERHRRFRYGETISPHVSVVGVIEQLETSLKARLGTI